MRRVVAVPFAAAVVVSTGCGSGRGGRDCGSDEVRGGCCGGATGVGMKSSGIVVVARGADRRSRFGGLVTLLIYNLYAGSYIYRPRDENPSCLMQLLVMPGAVERSSYTYKPLPNGNHNHTL